MPLQQTSGNVTQDAYGGSAASLPVYVENVFSTYLYTGNNSSPITINNGIDLLDKGGLVWFKERTSYYSGDHALWSNGSSHTYLSSDTTAASISDTDLTSFNTNGFTVNGGNNLWSRSPANYVSWTFRKQPKFFDIVTYTGTGSVQNIAHNLGSIPGCIIIKSTSSISNWPIYHKGFNGGVTPEHYYAYLQNTAAAGAYSPMWNDTAPTSTQFTVGANTFNNNSGKTYIAYIFGAGGTGGFGLTGTQDIISCGSFAQGSAVTLGWEPQWLLIKDAGNTGDWYIMDNMRGLTASGQYVPYLVADTSSAEGNFGATALCSINATGFNAVGFATGGPYIYIAIRRGPMATPTTGTSVFQTIIKNTSTLPTTVTTNIISDLVIEDTKTGGGGTIVVDRLRGDSTNNYAYLQTWTNGVEADGTGNGFGLDSNVAIVDNLTSDTNDIFWNFARAPGFFDVVCYTGTLPLNSTSSQTVNHNLTVAPQLLIGKSRTTSSTNWIVCFNMNSSTFERMSLNLNASTSGAITYGNYRIMLAAQPTATQVFFGSSGNTSNNLSYSGDNYVLYLFATCPGVSYVGSYTGTGATQSIACGFGASGARFILAKQTDATGDWYCWDSANGLTSSSSPYLKWDSNATQTTGNNGTYASSGWFTLTSASPVNTSGGTFIFLAIA